LTVDRSEGDTNLSSRRRAWAERHHGEATRRWLAADADHFLHQSLSTPCLDVVVKAEGLWLETLDGRRYMDFHGNNVHHIGHGHPRLREVLKRQLDDLVFVPRRFTDLPAIRLAERLGALAPGRLDRVLFAPGGSEAIEMAIKLARAATGRHKTVSFWDSFHGAGFGAVSVGGEKLFRAAPFGPLLPGTEHVAPFACYRCPYGYPADADGRPQLEVCRTTCASFVGYVLEKEGDVAAVIAEPIRSVPYLPPPGFWREVRRACDAHGALLIFDEIPSGLGKTGRMFACEHAEVVPDILVLGKALGGGIVPIAALLARADLDVVPDRALGHYTHEKNPFTCTAALETLAIIEDEGLVANAAIQGAYFLERLAALRARHPLIGDVRGQGLLVGVELVSDRATKHPADDAADHVLYAALDRGLSFKTTMGNVLTLTPPLTVTREEIDRAVTILDASLAEAERAASMSGAP
jgi:(R)-1-hydroxy-2-aminoethylphosphonate ammonia-lyase